MDASSPVFNPRPSRAATPLPRPGGESPARIQPTPRLATHRPFHHSWRQDYTIIVVAQPIQPMVKHWAAAAIYNGEKSPIPYDLIHPTHQFILGYHDNEALEWLLPVEEDVGIWSTYGVAWRQDECSDEQFNVPEMRTSPGDPCTGFKRP
jgi:hypothetical protein